MGVFSAYLITLGVIVYRWEKGPHQAPPPMAFLGANIIFGAVSLISSKNKSLGDTLAWAFLVGALVAPKTNITAVNRVIGTPTDAENLATQRMGATDAPGAPGVTATEGIGMPFSSNPINMGSLTPQQFSQMPKLSQITKGGADAPNYQLPPFTNG